MTVKQFIKRLIGPTLLGVLDYYRDEELRDTLGGVFNGQQFRREMIREVTTISKPDFIVETGTFRGASTEFLACLTSGPVHSIEREARFYGYSRARLRKLPRVRLHTGDSRAVLRDLLRQRALPETTGFFYLDAHWETDLPLSEEIELIFGNWASALVLIDDFQVPDDAGYRFDDYGPGKALTLDYLAPLKERFNFDIWFPACPSNLETGARRGSVLLSRENASAGLAGLRSIRRWQG